MEGGASRLHNHDIPILEFDPAGEALIEPSRLLQRADAPEHVVLCLLEHAYEAVLEEHPDAPVAATLRSNMGKHSLHRLEVAGTAVGVFGPVLGGPLAGGLLEELIAIGCSKFIAVGTAGVLNGEIAAGHAIVPVSAVRDEGTSYHYLPPSREVEPSPEAVEAIRLTLREHGVDFVEGKTWTTDAFYRETRSRVKRRREEGCLTVEMEAASLFAVARFRGVTLGQILCGADSLDAQEWDNRSGQHHSGASRLFWLAAEACLRL